MSTAAQMPNSDRMRFRWSRASEMISSLMISARLNIAVYKSWLYHWASTIKLSFQKLDDFGPDHFKTPLNILIDEYDNDPFISPIGRAQVYNDLVRCAANRLIIQDRINKTPQLSSTPLTRPLSVSGLPRSGTTHLVNLLAADSRFQNLPLWVAQEPFCAPGQNKSGLGLKLRAKFLNRLLKNGDSRTDDPRFYRCSLRWSGMKIMGPELASMHPMNPDHVHEELELMTFDFGCNQFEWTSVTPNYRDHYYATDQTPHYGYMKNVLKLLQLERGDVRPWVLKCVQNPEQLPALIHRHNAGMGPPHAAYRGKSTRRSGLLDG